MAVGPRILNVQYDRNYTLTYRAKQARGQTFAP